MAKRRWLLPVAALAGAWLYREWQRGSFDRWTEGFHRCSMPSAASYDRAARVLMSGLYDRIAAELVAANPSGEVLDVGAGPGWLDIRLAQLAPALSITGVDVEPAMVERATVHAEEAGVSGRVRFQVGDSAKLPFDDDRFDLVTSSFSLHHWEDPARGVAEVYRVLKPGGQARIYDLPDWFRKRFHGVTSYDSMADLASASPFGSGVTVTFRWPDRVPSAMSLWLRKEPAEAGTSGGGAV